MSIGYVWGNQSMPEILLETKRLDVMRGGVPVVRDINMKVAKGETIAVIGPNGAGKSTLFGAIMGLYKIAGGNIVYAGQQIQKMKTKKISKMISMIPQESATFPFLSVLDNLWIAEDVSKKKVLEDEVFDLFPILREKMDQESWSLSGGQRQMLAIAMGLLRRSQLLILDEPTLGLSPVNVGIMLDIIKRINCERGITVLISDQTPRVLDVAERVYVLEGGQIRIEGRSEDLRTDDRIIKVYLGMDV